MSVVGDYDYLVKAYLLATYGILVNDCQNNYNEAFKKNMFSSDLEHKKCFSDVHTALISLKMGLVLLSVSCDLKRWEVG